MSTTMQRRPRRQYTPEFRAGDEVVLFLKQAGPSHLSVIGLSQGAFRVVPDARTGRRMVTTPIVMGKSGDRPERIVRGDVTRKPLPIDAFRDALAYWTAHRHPFTWRKRPQEQPSPVVTDYAVSLTCR